MEGRRRLYRAAQARAFFQNGDTVLQLSTDADAAAEMEIVVKGLHLFTAADFMGIYS